MQAARITRRPLESPPRSKRAGAIRFVLVLADPLASPLACACAAFWVVLLQGQAISVRSRAGEGRAASPLHPWRVLWLGSRLLEILVSQKSKETRFYGQEGLASEQQPHARLSFRWLCG